MSSSPILLSALLLVAAPCALAQMPASKGGSSPDIATSVSVAPYPSAGTQVTVTTIYTNTPTAGTEALFDVELSEPWNLVQSDCGFTQEAPGHARAIFVIAADQTIQCRNYFQIPPTFVGPLEIDASAVSLTDPNVANNSDQTTATVVRLRVTTTQDLLDHAPGDGVCQDAITGLPVCSLRAAIIEANALPGWQRIELPWNADSYVLTRQGADTGANGDLDVTDAVTIEGFPGTGGARPVVATAFSTEVHRVLDIDADQHAVTLKEVQLAGAEAAVTGTGGVLRHAAGFLNLLGVDVSGGAATSAGGGIALSAPAILRFVSVRENSAPVGAGVAAEFDGEEWLQLHDSELRDNIAEGDETWGGGLYVVGGELEIERSLLAYNAADRGGGAMFLATTATVENATFSNNTAAISGGGMQASISSLDLRWATVADNAAAPGDDNSGLGGGIYKDALSTVEVQSSIFVGNTAQVRLEDGGPFAIPFPHSAACDGSIDSLGHNAVQPVSTDQACAWDGHDGDQLDVHAGVGPLADNGGYTMTRALLAGAAEIDSGYPGCPGASGTVSLDQRAMARPLDGDGNGNAQCDKGAFEFVPVAVVRVVKQGDGDGVISSDPAGIHCGATCSAEFAAGSQVTLIPSQGPGSVFAGWVSPCTGTGQCVITAQPGETEVIAAFTQPMQAVRVFGDGFE